MIDCPVAARTDRLCRGWGDQPRRLLVGLTCWCVLSGLSTSVVADEVTTDAVDRSAVATDEAALAHFETSIRPVLSETCLPCHGAHKQSGGLRLDSRASLLTGGESGPALVPGQAAESLLLQAIRHEGGLEMPPNKPLSPAQITAFATWIAQGAPWPESNVPLRSAIDLATERHWAFQPVQDPAIPRNTGTAWGRNAIDAFVAEQHAVAGLVPSPEADRPTLIRRLSYTLTGLPPSVEEVERFVADADPLAYERLVDRLLDSPHYGEHWARHWLDVARYSDTKGYVYAREERFWVHAWTYRDWVVRAFNEDMAYDRFLRLQIAGDQIPDRRPDDLAAMGFLTLGRRFLGVERDIIDDRIDVVCRGTLGLTVGCARCHDHKYDPIPTTDYYALYGVFDSCQESLVPLDSVAGEDAFAAELRKRQEALESGRQAARQEWSNFVRARVSDYLTAQTELSKYPPKGFDQVFEKSDVLPAFVRQWENFLRLAKRRNDPVFVHWHAYMELPPEEFGERAASITHELADAAAANPLVAAEFATPPGSFGDVIARYAALFADIEARWTARVAAAASDGEAVTGFADASEEQLRRVLYGPGAPCEVPDEPIVHIEDFMDSAQCTNLWKLQGEVDRWIIQASPGVPFAVSLVDREEPSQPRVFVRGNPATPGDEVPRRFLTLLSAEGTESFASGSGRRELAEAIVDPHNPLTARVLVNRMWAHHFGAGLVTTPSDFGTRADPPSHPALLDWLARRFMEGGWNVKALHRLILTSSTYRQHSTGPVDVQARSRALQRDPENRLLWRMNAKRLSFEEFRDSWLAVGGDLDAAVGGKPADLFQQPFPTRRTLYGLVDRQFFPSGLRVFDFANPDLHIPQRSETTVPQQALFVLNHPFAIERAKALAARVDAASSAEEIVATLYRRALQRDPTTVELSRAAQFLQPVDAVDGPPPAATVADWGYGFGTYDEASQQVTGWTPLPYFSGSAWQGGSSWPDATLGWVQLTADGGHPGNDRAHAAVRRWTAPRPITVQIQSTLMHEVAAGDGIRAFLISSRSGLLATATVHQQTVELNVDRLDVEAGETIDFVVDIGDVLNSDQYLWRATVRQQPSADATPQPSAVTWDSQTDFAGPPTAQLTAVEQLAQVLLSANEFLFID